MWRIAVYLLIVVGCAWPTFARMQGQQTCQVLSNSAVAGRTTRSVDVLALPEVGVESGELDAHKRFTITGVDCTLSEPWLRIGTLFEEETIEGWIPLASAEVSEQGGLIHRYGDSTYETTASSADVEWRPLGFVRSPQHILRFDLQGDRPDQADIFYKDDLLEDEDIQYEGLTEDGEHQFLLSSLWVAIHIGWIYPSNFSISWECDQIPAEPTPNA